MNNKFSLSFSQYVFLIYKTQVGIGVLTLPRDLFKVGDYDGWLAIFFGWLISVFVSLLIIRTMEKHPDQTLFELLPQLFGKFFGNLLIACWVLYALFTSSYVFIYAANLIKLWILPNTNLTLIGLLFILPIYYITKRGLPLISRYAEFTFLSSIWLYVVILISARHGIWQNLFPIVRDGWMPILHATPMTILSFLGFEQIFLLYPKLQNKHKAVKGMVIANSFNALIVLMVTVVAFVRMTKVELTLINWPTLNLLKLVRFPFLERLEVVFISAYLIVLMMTIIPYLHMTLVGTTQLLKRPKLRTPLLLVILIAWLLVLYSPFVYHTTLVETKKWLIYAGVIFAIVFPILLWVYNKAFLAIRGRHKTG